MQGLMLQDFNAEGSIKYANFLETTTQILPMYMLRALGGTLYLTGMIVMAYNLIKTAKQGSLIADEADEAAPLQKNYKENALTGYLRHRIIERKPILLLVMSTIVIAIGGLVEFIPVFTIKSNIPTIASVHPYSPLELEGRDIYIREGCNNCHSQMVRPFRSETERYGEYAKAGEFVYDHPFLWGSKRTGPDLLREGGKNPNAWQYRHLINPRSTSPGSIMPEYPWLAKNDLDLSDTRAKIKVMRKLGVPYPFGYEDEAENLVEGQAKFIQESLAQNNINISEKKEIIALIAYLQRLGTDIKGDHGLK
jgi:cytochrome c oxidase cbb3-type subunit I/II